MNIVDWRIKYSELSDKYNIASDLIVELRQQNTALQARIKELEEPKTCDGCKYLKPETCDDYEQCKFDDTCIRWEANLKTDHFQSKQN